MKIGDNFPGFNISAEGLKIQRQKMNIIAENIANADTVRDENGNPYKRKFIVVEQKASPFTNSVSTASNLNMNKSNSSHFSPAVVNIPGSTNPGLTSAEYSDQETGDIIYMPEHPYADEKGYVQMSNVNIITEMIEMISATRSYEANLTALNSSKQMAKDALEI